VVLQQRHQLSPQVWGVDVHGVGVSLCRGPALFCGHIQPADPGIRHTQEHAGELYNNFSVTQNSFARIFVPIVNLHHFFYKNNHRHELLAVKFINSCPT
jgi:hypothetical protein